jgi:hypothetical protein
MTDVSTINASEMIDEFVPATGDWTWETTRIPVSRERVQRMGSLRSTGVAIALALSPITAAIDPWVADRRRLETLSVSSFSPIFGRRISLVDARRLALRILQEMEDGRLAAAEEEAERVFDLEEID